MRDVILQELSGFCEEAVEVSKPRDLGILSCHPLHLSSFIQGLQLRSSFTALTHQKIFHEIGNDKVAEIPKANCLWIFKSHVAYHLQHVENYLKKWK